MNKDAILKALAEQKDEKTRFQSKKWVARKEESLLSPESPFAQIVIGVRRSGKSTLCHKFLIDNKINYAFVNFDDERLSDFSYIQFDDLLEVLYVLYGSFSTIFIDEPQNIERWHLFINRLLRQNFNVFLTGSNAKLLSGELATHLTGRFIQIELFPFSFCEYLDIKEITTDRLLSRNRAAHSIAFDEYLQKGGLPEIINAKSWQNYLQNLFTSIVDRDIVARFKIRHKKAMRDLAEFAIANFSREVNYKKTTNLLALKSENTVKNYFDHLEQAYLLIGLSKFSFKSSERIRNKKFYTIDLGFLTVVSTLENSDESWRLENLVLIELLRHRFEDASQIHYYKTYYEVDFVISKGRKVLELIQVSVNIDNPKTYQREINGLKNSAKELNCKKLTLINKHITETIVVDEVTIELISIFDWLLKK